MQPIVFFIQEFLNWEILTCDQIRCFSIIPSCSGAVCQQSRLLCPRVQWWLKHTILIQQSPREVKGHRERVVGCIAER